MSNAELNATVNKITEVSPGLIIMQVKTDGWELPKFEAGQYAVLGLPGSAPRAELSDKEEKPADPDKIIKRAYSIASASSEKEYLELYITLVRSGSLTPRLFALKEGDKLFMGNKFKGVFTIDRAPDDANLVFIATGTGLAPYMSMIRTSYKCDVNRHFAVLHGARHSWDLGYRAELINLAETCDNFEYFPIISRPKDEPDGWHSQAGYVQDLWKKGVVEKEMGITLTPDNAHIFLCGAPAMAEEMVQLLESAGYKEHKKKDPGQIHVERFW